jgi:hypothetical protein
MGSTKVALVLDREYGEKLRHLAAQMAVWIVDTPSNKTIALELWGQKPKPDHMITTFTSPETLDDTCFEGLMDNIELHHGHYSQNPPFEELEVVGLIPTPEVEKVLTEFGFSRTEKTTNGFRARRLPET